jgi:hypothetical protein
MKLQKGIGVWGLLVWEVWQGSTLWEGEGRKYRVNKGCHYASKRLSGDESCLGVALFLAKHTYKWKFPL